ncbi:DUF2291 family protein [Roseibium algae]|uniref:DUF2291 domain-containing protein n=1 Tax=Roseibium algae TaxID=3123038 RepID=A0ABU8TN96_9HYPH
MLKPFFLPVCLVAALCLLPACKIVKTDQASSDETPAGPEGDETRVSLIVEDSFASNVIPNIKSTATDISTLQKAVAKGLDAAGDAYGVRPSGAGSSWNFAVTGKGKIVAHNLTSRAATLDLDTNSDGQGDIILQLGPVVKGSALRDVSPTYVFTNFRDQIEFAKLGRALNTAALAGITPPAGDPSGKTVTFVGATSLRSASDPIRVLPIELEVAQ